MDAPRYNSPSRKSRFRAQGASSHRPASPADESVPVTDETQPAYAPETTDADAPPLGDATALAQQADSGAPADVSTVESAPAMESTEPDSLPAGLRLTRSTDRSSRGARERSVWPVIVVGVLCLAAGGLGGYLLRGRTMGAGPTDRVVSATGGRVATPTLPLSPPTLAEVDAAFVLMKTGRFADARANFQGLADRHPEWPSMQIEAARAALYQHDFDNAEKILVSMLRTAPNADAEFLLGLLQMTMQAYEKSEAAFARAITLDPARPDIFYFWGECLRREGKPQDAADKFRAALSRNQYETTEGLYQLKLWLSEIQADQEGAKGANDKIDADLASGHPSGPALFAAAAREVKARQYKAAGEHIGQAQKVTEPAVFRVILQDPTFLEEHDRPELAPFYKT